MIRLFVDIPGGLNPENLELLQELIHHRDRVQVIDLDREDPIHYYGILTGAQEVHA